ncbi:MAG: Lin0512 family protein [Fervidicoccaceae archaeon]
MVEVGMGVDQHGQDPTKAAVKAIKDAVSRVCIPYLVSEGKLRDFAVEVEVGVPRSKEVRLKDLEDAIQIGKLRSLKVVEGGLSTACVEMKELGDRSSEMIIAVASITVLVRE